MAPRQAGREAQGGFERKSKIRHCPLQATLILPFCSERADAWSRSLKKQNTEKGSDQDDEQPSADEFAILSPKTEWLCLFLCSCLFLITPLYYLSLPAKGNWKEQTPPLLESIAREIFSFPLQNMEGFIPVRTVNAEYKLVVFLALASVVTGIVFCALHLKKRILRIPRPLLLFGGLFLGSVFLSSVFAHNFQRVGLFPSLAPGSRSLCSFLGSRSLDKKKDRIFPRQPADRRNRFVSRRHGSTLSMDGVEPRTPENRTRWIDLQQEFLPPNTMLRYFLLHSDLSFTYRSNGFRIALGLGLVLVFLPALTLSLARGAWVGLMGGCAMTLASLWGAWLAWRKKNPENRIQPKSFIPLGALLALGLALPLYIQTSNHWNKDSWIFSSEKKMRGISSPPTNSNAVSKETAELKSVTNVSGDGNIQRRFVLWQDALLACLSSDLLLGKGTDHYELHFHESAELSDKTTGGTLVRFVHNDFVQTLYENGLLGLIGFGGIWGWTLWRGLLSCLTRAKESDFFRPRA